MTPVSRFSNAVRGVQEFFGDVCFACGTHNQAGLHMRPVAYQDGWVRARFSPRPDHVGAPTVLHGGIAATAIDEIMVWAGIIHEAVMSVTGALDVKYRRPLPTEGVIEAFGRVVDRSGRRLRMEARLESEGRAAVYGTGLYIVSQDISHIIEPDGS